MALARFAALFDGSPAIRFSAQTVSQFMHGLNAHQAISPCLRAAQQQNTAMATFSRSDKYMLRARAKQASPPHYTHAQTHDGRFLYGETSKTWKKVCPGLALLLVRTCQAYPAVLGHVHMVLLCHVLHLRTAKPPINPA